ncbi:LIPA.2 family protein [Megaselia abdita]
MPNKYLLLISIIISIGFYQNIHLTWYGNAPDRISALGYQAEIHKITTQDGYILEAHRIPQTKKNRPVVLLVHGVFSSSDTFLLNGVENALGFQASNEGYDVWLLNLRGNRYSNHHVNLSTISMEFWAFTFHEMAVYDLPATIDYIMKVTGQQNIHYIGHSQATNIYFALLSEKPEYNKFLKTGHLLASGLSQEDSVIDRVYLGNITLPFINFFDYGSFGMHFYFAPLNYVLWVISQTPAIGAVFSKAIGIFGGSSITLNMTILPDILATMPTGSSARNVIHLSQGCRNFRQFDFGLEEENIKRYGSKVPRFYDFGNIDVPTYIHNGGQDNIVSLACVNSISKKLRKGVLKKVIIHDEFSHIDFVASVESKKRINDFIFEVIQNYEMGGKL